MVSRYIVTKLDSHLCSDFYFLISLKGEANSGGHNTDKYSCIFSQMIGEWRKVWEEKSGGLTSQFPFGFVQLAQNQANNHYNGFPLIKWHQTHDYGYVPNEELNVLTKNAYYIRSLNSTLYCSIKNGTVSLFFTLAT